ncbi:hypothetical protein Droror1_Dr00001147 [Drosera rotundifolia]
MPGNGRLHMLDLSAPSPVSPISELMAFDIADGVYDLAWSESHDNLLVAALTDGSLKLYDVSLPPQLNPMRSLREHTCEVFSADWNPARHDFFLSPRVTTPSSCGPPTAPTPTAPSPSTLTASTPPPDEAAVIVFVPVAGDDFVLVGGDDDGGGGLTDVPDTEGAVAGNGGEDVRVTGVPGSGVDAVGVLRESAEGGGAVGGPQLDGVVPRGGQEGVAAGGVQSAECTSWACSWRDRIGLDWGDFDWGGRDTSYSFRDRQPPLSQETAETGEGEGAEGEGADMSTTWRRRRCP